MSGGQGLPPPPPTFTPPPPPFSGSGGNTLPPPDFTPPPNFVPPPPAYSSPTVSVSGSGGQNSVSFSFSATSGMGGLGNFTYSWSISGPGGTVSTGTGSSASASGLSDSTTYTCSVSVTEYNYIYGFTLGGSGSGSATTNAAVANFTPSCTVSGTSGYDSTNGYSVSFMVANMVWDGGGAYSHTYENFNWSIANPSGTVVASGTATGNTPFFVDATNLSPGTTYTCTVLMYSYYPAKSAIIYGGGSGQATTPTPPPPPPTPPSWTDTTLAPFTAGEAYSDGVSASNANAATPYTLASGSLPTGISLNGSTGAVTGTPTIPGENYSFVLQANGISSITASFSGTVGAYRGQVWVYNGTTWVQSPAQSIDGITAYQVYYTTDGSTWTRSY